MRNPKEVYCEHCDDIVVGYTTKKIKRTLTVGAKTDRPATFETEYIVAYCPICGGEVWPNAVAKQNEITVYNHYKKAVGLLTTDEIKAIRKKRGLSQVQLAQLIHCGEKNIARYENGGIQDKVFDLLIRLVDNDETYKILKSMEHTYDTNKTHTQPNSISNQ